METIREYTDYAVECALEFLAIPSPSGYTEKAADWIVKTFSELGYEPERTRKGGVLVSLSGPEPSEAVMLQAHIDTLGGMIAEIKDTGRLRLTPVGSLNAYNTETENCTIVTRKSGTYEGTYQLTDASTHVNAVYSDTKRTFDTMEVVIDEEVANKQDVLALGISVGDFVCFEPRSRVTASGYIKSRFLDDKLSVGILIAYAKYLKDRGKPPAKPTVLYFTAFEEVGHGASSNVGPNIAEILCVDMGCVGEGLTCTERMVSICAKDNTGPYHRDVVNRLVEAAEKAGAKYAVDVYPDYFSDAKATLAAGVDARHGCLGPGVYASHGYERGHRDGVTNTLRLLGTYLDEV